MNTNTFGAAAATFSADPIAEIPQNADAAPENLPQSLSAPTDI